MPQACTKETSDIRCDIYCYVDCLPANTPHVLQYEALQTRIQARKLVGYTAVYYLVNRWLYQDYSRSQPEGSSKLRMVEVS